MDQRRPSVPERHRRAAASRLCPMRRYIVVFLATRPNIGSRLAHRIGDLSYGLYLFGWPVEQLTQQLTGSRSGWELFLYSLVPTLAVAAVSWWVVERPLIK